MIPYWNRTITSFQPFSVRSAISACSAFALVFFAVTVFSQVNPAQLAQELLDAKTVPEREAVLRARKDQLSKEVYAILIHTGDRMLYPKPTERTVEIFHLALNVAQMIQHNRELSDVFASPVIAQGRKRAVLNELLARLTLKPTASNISAKAAV